MILKFNSIEYNKFYFLFNEIIDFNNFLNKSFFNYCQMYYFNSFFIFEKRFFKKIHFDFSFYKSRFIFYYYKNFKINSDFLYFLLFKNKMLLKLRFIYQFLCYDIGFLDDNFFLIKIIIYMHFFNRIIV